jgi:hypothetical protein
VNLQALWDSSGKMASWDGLDFLSLSRPGEIGAGDRFFSPFIAPGWSEKEELNLRPSQDLAILKHLMGTGAEYIHVGFFNGVARGSNWIWQAAMPVYSQGVATAVADLWRNSHLLAGDMPNAEWKCYTIGTPLRGNPKLQETCTKFPLAAACGETNVIGTGDRCTPPDMPESGWYSPVSWRFWSGSQSIPVFVRKHDTKDQYLITASVQPQSNMIGNAPDAANVTIFLGELPVRFEARRQGSVYVLDLTTGGANGTLTQADSWHELGHPQHWSQDFEFEAELHTGIASDTALTSLHTRTELRNSARHSLDFVGSTSFLDVSAASPFFEYHFQSRGTRTLEYVIWLRSRSPTNSHSDGCVLAVGLNGQRLGNTSCGSGEFGWSRIDGLLVAKPGEHALSLHVLSGQAHIDSIRLVRVDQGDDQHLHRLKNDDIASTLVFKFPVSATNSHRIGLLYERDAAGCTGPSCSIWFAPIRTFGKSDDDDNSPFDQGLRRPLPAPTKRQVRWYMASGADMDMALNTAWLAGPTRACMSNLLHAPSCTRACTTAPFAHTCSAAQTPSTERRSLGRMPAATSSR